MVECKPWQSIYLTSITQTTIYRHFENIGKAGKLGVWVSHTLSDKKKSIWVSIATRFLSRQRNYLFLKRNIIRDENWVTYYNWQHKRQWLTRIHFHNLFQKPTFTEEQYYCVYGEIIVNRRFIRPSTVACSIEKCPVLVNRKNVVLLATQDHISKGNAGKNCRA